MRIGTEFGQALQTMVRGTPGAMAAVLSDNVGDAIDFVHDAEELSELDVQLLAAQVGQQLIKLEATYRRHRLRSASLLLESSACGLMAGVVGDEYVLAMLLERRANVARAFSTFEQGRTALRELL